MDMLFISDYLFAWLTTIHVVLVDAVLYIDSTIIGGNLYPWCYNALNSLSIG